LLRVAPERGEKSPLDGKAIDGPDEAARVAASEIRVLAS
jgi:hypothetical protein